MLTTKSENVLGLKHIFWPLSRWYRYYRNTHSSSLGSMLFGAYVDCFVQHDKIDVLVKF